MSDPAKRLAEAEREAVVARERLSSTVATLQIKLDPKTLARSTVNDIADRSSAAAKAGIETARSNRVLLTGVAALAGLFLVSRSVVKTVRRRAKTRRDKHAHRKKESS